MGQIDIFQQLLELKERINTAVREFIRQCDGKNVCSVILDNRLISQLYWIKTVTTIY
jgi:hypothetical protein